MTDMDHYQEGLRLCVAAENNFDAGEDLRERFYPLMAMAGVHLLAALVDQVVAVTDAIAAAG